MPAGTAAVELAAWTLPVAVTSPDSSGNAAGAGGLALVLKDGLTAKWKGAGSVGGGPVILIVDTGLLTFAAFAALGLGVRQVIPLWSKQPGGPPSSRLEIDVPAQFPLTFYSSSAGVEMVALLGSIDASFDRPVTVAGNRVFIVSKLALILFVELSVFTGVLVEAALDPPPTPVQDLAFAIANAVFRTTPANALLLVAAFEGTASPSGGVAIGFGLQYLLPILPDPYAANVDVPYQRLRDTGVIGPMSAIVLWTAANPPRSLTLCPRALSRPPCPCQPALPRGTWLRRTSRPTFPPQERPQLRRRRGSQAHSSCSTFPPTSISSVSRSPKAWHQPRRPHSPWRPCTSRYPAVRSMS